MVSGVHVASFRLLPIFFPRSGQRYSSPPADPNFTMKTKSDRGGSVQRLVSRWSDKQQEQAHSIVNDIAEDIDNGEGRKQLRQALAIYADLYYDAMQALKLKELGEASELCKRLEAAIAANVKGQARSNKTV